MKLTRFFSLITLIILLAVSACNKKEVDQPAVDKSNLAVLPNMYFSFNFTQNSLSFCLVNFGDASASWSMVDSVDYLTFYPSMGEILPGDSVIVSVLLDRTKLNDQVNNATVQVIAYPTQLIELNFSIEHYTLVRNIKDGFVIDVEYDRINDLIVIALDEPKELLIYNTLNQTFQSVTLVLPPTAVSVGQDGHYAVVGHDAWFSYVNLHTMEVEDVYSVATRVGDIILAPNNYVYVLSDIDDLGMRCINLLTKVETFHTGTGIYFIRADYKMKLHPSGTHIYCVVKGGASANLHKFDLSEGTAKYMYSWPFLSNYETGGFIWISDDGNRIFTKRKNVFSASNDSVHDMLYAGTLDGDGFVQTVDQHSLGNKTFAVMKSLNYYEKYDSVVRKYTADYLSFDGTFAIPKILAPNGGFTTTFYDSEGHYGFFNSNGTQYYLIVKSSSFHNAWGITSFEVY